MSVTLTSKKFAKGRFSLRNGYILIPEFRVALEIIESTFPTGLCFNPFEVYKYAKINEEEAIVVIERPIIYK